jgi:tubulin monoglycylase TTLL3/8
VNKHGNHDPNTDLFWTMDQLSDFMQKQAGYDYFRTVMKPRMKKIVNWSLMSCQENVQNRKNSSEIYGYDFCIDDDWKLWLIEVNASPAFDFSSDVTERLVKMVREDYIKVVVDYGTASKGHRPHVDTGGWECIHRTRIPVQNGRESMGIDLEIKGRTIEAKALRQMGNFNF